MPAAAATWPRCWRETELFALHVPFRSLPEETLAGLVRRYLGSDAAAAGAFLARRRFSAGTAPAAVVGNVYSGSMFLSLAALLAARHEESPAALAGKQAVLVAYGSGNTALALAGRVSAQAPAVIGGWCLQRALSQGEEASLEDYDAWIAERDRTGCSAESAASRIPEHRFYLQSIRADGYRVYALRGA